MADKIKGITIEIGGDTTSLQKELEAAGDRSRDASKELSQINNALKFDPSNVTLLGQKVDVLKDRVSGAEDKLRALRSAEEEVEKQFKNDDIGADEYRKFQRDVEIAESQVKTFKGQLSDAQQELNQHTSVVGKVGDKYQELKGKVKQSLETFKGEHPKAAKAVEVTKKAAESLSKGVAGAMKGMAVGAAAAFGAMTTGAVALGKAIFNSAKEASEYGDQIDKASQKMGVSAERYQELAHAADLSGTSMATLQKAQQKLQASGSKLDISGALDQLYKIEDADKRAAAAHEMFGDKIANELAPMLNAGKEGFDAMVQGAHDFGLIMSDEAIAAAAQFDDTLTTMKDTVSMVGHNLAAEFMPGINEIMEGITGIFTGDEGAAAKIEQGVDDIAGAFDKVIPVVTTIFNNLLDTVVQIAPQIIVSLCDSLINNLNQLIDAALQIVQALADGLLTSENISKIMQAAVQLVTSLVGFLSQNVNMLVSAALMMVTELINALSNPAAMQQLLHGAVQLITGLLTALIDNAPMLISAALEMVGVLVNELINYDWWSVAKRIFNSIKDAIKNLITSFGGGGDDKPHAGGIGFVPRDDYNAVLHRGERVLTAAQNEQYSSGMSAEQYERLDRRLSSIERGLNNVANTTVVENNFTGSAGRVARALEPEVKREQIRRTAFKEKRGTA